MTSGQKISLSLLLSVVIFSVFSVFAFSGLFQYIETHFYNKKVKENINTTLSRAVELIDTYHEANRNRFEEILSQPSVLNIYELNASAEEIAAREQFFFTLQDEIPALSFVRFIDKDNERIHFSTLNTDILRRGEFQLVYKPISQVEEEPQLSEIGLTEDDDADIFNSTASNHIIYRFPFYDSYDIFQGTALFYVSLRDINNILVEHSINNIGERAEVIAENGVILNTGPEFQDNLETAIQNAWENISDNPLLNTIENPEGNNYYIFTQKTEAGTKAGFLVSETEFDMNPIMRIILLASIFLTSFLLFFLIFNLKQDSMLVLSDRVKRFQISLLQEYMNSKEEIDWKRWQAELASRREEVSREIKRGIGRLKENEKEEVDRLVDKSWDEILRIIGSRGEEEQIKFGASSSSLDIKRLEEIVERVVSNVQMLTREQEGRKIGPPQTGQKESTRKEGPVKAPVTEKVKEEESGEAADLEEVEVLEEAPDATETQIAGEPEDLESLEEAEELTEAESQEQTEEIEVAPESLETGEGEDLEEVDEVEELDEAEEFEGAEDFAEIEQEYAKSEDLESEELGDLEEIEEVEEAPESKAQEEASEEGEAEDRETVEEVSEAEDLEEAELLEEFEEAGETEDIEELTALEIEGAGALEEMEEAEEEEEELGELEEFEDQEEITSEYVPTRDEISEIFESLKDPEAEIEGAPTILDEMEEEVESSEYYPDKQSVDKERGEEEEPLDIEISAGGTRAERPDYRNITHEEAETEEVAELASLEEVQEEAARLSSFEEEQEEETELIAELESVGEESFGETADLRQEVRYGGMNLASAYYFGREFIDKQYFHPVESDTAELIDLENNEGSSGVSADEYQTGREEEEEPEEFEELEELEELSESDYRETRDFEEIETLEEVQEDEGLERLEELEEQLEEIDTREVQFEPLQEIVSDIPFNELLNLLQPDNSIIMNSEGVFQIRGEFEESRELFDTQFKDLIDSVIQEEDVRDESEGIDDILSIGSIELLPVGEEIDENLSEDKYSDSMFHGKKKLLFKENGLDYDAFFNTYRQNERGIIKSLVDFTRRWDATAAAILTEDEYGYSPDYSLGLDDDCLLSVLIKKTSELYRNYLEKRRIVFVKRRLDRIEEFRNACSEVKMNFFKKSIFFPVEFRQKNAYILLGIHDYVEDLEEYLKEVINAEVKEKVK